MKVLQVTTHLNMGGIANYILSLCRKLEAMGIGCVAASSGGDLDPEFEKSGIHRKRLNMRTKNEFGLKVFSSIFSLVKIIKEEKIDIIHAHTRVSQAAVFFASQITGVPYITTCHGFFKKRLRKIFDTWGRRVIAISEAVADHLERDLGVKKERIVLIYNGVDADRFSKGYPAERPDIVKKSLGIKGGPVIGTIGRLSPVKGQRFLIEAMARVVADRKDAELLIVGDGPEGEDLRNHARSLGLESAVHFIGSSPDTRKFLSVMDIFVFPSVKEGLGIALLEALAAGRACVASEVGGIGTIIKDGLNGLLVPVGDPVAMAGAISAILDDREWAGRMGENGRAMVRETFSLDSMAGRVIALYREVLG